MSSIDVLTNAIDGALSHIDLFNNLVRASQCEMIVYGGFMIHAIRHIDSQQPMSSIFDNISDIDVMLFADENPCKVRDFVLNLAASGCSEIRKIDLPRRKYQSCIYQYRITVDYRGKAIPFDISISHSYGTTYDFLCNTLAILYPKNALPCRMITTLQYAPESVALYTLDEIIQAILDAQIVVICDDKYLDSEALRQRYLRLVIKGFKLLQGNLMWLNDTEFYKTLIFSQKIS